MHETVFRNLLQRTKDTITKAVKDNLPPEVGEEVTDLVLNVRPACKEAQAPSKKPVDTTIGKKVRAMLEADIKRAQQPFQQPHTTSSPDVQDLQPPSRKPAQLTKNPSALCQSDLDIKERLAIDVPHPSAAEAVILKASNRPSTPKTTAKISRVIGATKVAAVAPGSSGIYVLENILLT